MHPTSRGFFLVAFALSACGKPLPPQWEYVHVQRENGLAMRAPITIIYRVGVDTAGRKIKVLEDVVDVDGVADRRLHTYGDFQGSYCEMFDAESWRCTLRAPTDNAVVKQLEMREGRLTEVYFGIVRNFERRARQGAKGRSSS